MTTAIMGTLTLGASAATVWYVDGDTGNDSTGDGSSGTPWATIQHAIDDAGVLDGDTISIASGLYPEILTVDKELELWGGTILVTSLDASSEGAAVRVTADNVSFNMVGFLTDPSLDEGGSMLYAADTGDGVLEGFVLHLCDFDAEQATPPVGVSGLTCVTLHNPSAASLIENHFYVDGGALGTNADNAIAVRGGQANGGVNNRLLNNTITPSFDPFGAGVGISIQPGQGDSDGVGASGFDLIDNYISWGLSTAIEISDEQTGASEGISDILIQHNSMYYDGTAIAIHGLANDPGAGISDIRICENVDIYNTGWNDYGIHITQSGTGTPNIDFSSVKLRGSTFTQHNLYGVLNEISGTTFDARFNAWGHVTGPNDDAGFISGLGDRISLGVDASDWFRGYLMRSGFTEITSAGATDEISVSATNAASALELDLDPGITGEVDLAIVYYDSGFPQGSNGIVNGHFLPHMVVINSDDLSDGDFVALLKYTYNEYTVTTTLGVSEEEVVIYSWNPGTFTWGPTVNFNTTGTSNWLGDSAPPSPPYDSHLGEHGVDTATNTAWAVIDHFTDFAAGEGVSGVPVELSVFSVD